MANPKNILIFSKTPLEVDIFLQLVNRFYPLHKLKLLFLRYNVFVHSKIMQYNQEP